MVHCVRPEGTPGAGDPWDFPLDELAVVRQFGEPIFPALVPMDQVQQGPADAELFVEFDPLMFRGIIQSQPRTH